MPMTTRQLYLFYGTLLFLILLPLAIVRLKSGPTGVLLAILFLNAILSQWTDHPVRQRFSGRLLVALVGCSCVVGVFLVAVWAVPPVSGVYPVMALGQWLASLIVGGTLTAVLSYFYFHHRLQHDRLEKIVLLVVLAVLAAQAAFHFWMSGEA
jgi:hypothetical protein